MPAVTTDRAPVAAGLALVALAPLAPWHVVGAGGGSVGPGAWTSAFGGTATAAVAVLALVVGAVTGIGALVARGRVAAVVGGALVVGLAVVGWTSRDDGVGAWPASVWWAPGPLVMVAGGTLLVLAGLRPAPAPDDARSTGPAALSLGCAALALLAVSGPWWVEPGVLVRSGGSTVTPMRRGTEVVGGWVALALLVALVAGVAALGRRRPTTAAVLGGGVGAATAVLGGLVRIADATLGSDLPTVAIVVGAVSAVVAVVALGAAGSAEGRAPIGVAVGPAAVIAVASFLPLTPGPGPTVEPGAGLAPIRVLAGADGRSGVRPGLDARQLGAPVVLVGTQPAPGDAYGDLLGPGGTSLELLLEGAGALVAVRDHRLRPLVTLPHGALSIVGRNGDATIVAQGQDRRLSAWADGADDATDPGVRPLPWPGQGDPAAYAVGPDGALWVAHAPADGEVLLVSWGPEDVRLAAEGRGDLGAGTEVAAWSGPEPRALTVGADAVVAVVDAASTVRTVADGRARVVAARGGAGCAANDDPMRLAAPVVQAVPTASDEVWLVVDDEADEAGVPPASAGALNRASRGVLRVADGSAGELGATVGPLEVDRVTSILGGGVGLGLVAADAAGHVVDIGAPDEHLTPLPAPGDRCRAVPR